MPNDTHGLFHLNIKSTSVGLYSQTSSNPQSQNRRVCGSNFPSNLDLGGYQGDPYTYEIKQVTGVAAGTIFPQTGIMDWHTNNCYAGPGSVDFRAQSYTQLNPGEYYEIKSTNYFGDVKIFKFYTNPISNWGAVPEDAGVLLTFQPATNALEASLHTYDVPSAIRTDITFTDSTNVFPDKPIIPRGQTQNWSSLNWHYSPFNNNINTTWDAFNCEKEGGVGYTPDGDCALAVGGDNHYQKHTVDLSGPADGGSWGWDIPDGSGGNTRVIVVWAEIGAYFTPVSWNCSGSPNWVCTDPGDGSGTYSSLVDCNTACIESYNCIPVGVPGNVTYLCTDPNDGTGQYSSLVDCSVNCPGESWNCVQVPIISTIPGATAPTCQSIVGTTGSYTSLTHCEMSCGTSWDCKPGGMQVVDSHTGIFSAPIHDHISPNCKYNFIGPYRMMLMNGGTPMDSTTASEWHLFHSAINVHLRYDEMYHVAAITPGAPPNPCVDAASGSFYQYNTKPHFTNPGGIYDSNVFNSFDSWYEALEYLNNQYQTLGNGSHTSNTPFDYLMGGGGTYLDFDAIVQMMRDTCPFWGIDWETQPPPNGTLRTIFATSENCACYYEDCDCTEVPGTNGYPTEAHCESICCPTSWNCTAVATPSTPLGTCTDPGDGSGIHTDANSGGNPGDGLAACQDDCMTSWDCNPNAPIFVDDDDCLNPNKIFLDVDWWGPGGNGSDLAGIPYGFGVLGIAPFFANPANGHQYTKLSDCTFIKETEPIDFNLPYPYGMSWLPCTRFGTGALDIPNAVSALTHQYALYHGTRLSVGHYAGSSAVFPNAVNYDPVGDRCFNDTVGSNLYGVTWDCYFDTWADLITGCNIVGIVEPLSTTPMTMSTPFEMVKGSISFHFNQPGNPIGADSIHGRYGHCVCYDSTYCKCTKILGQGTNPYYNYPTEADCLTTCCGQYPDTWDCVQEDSSATIGPPGIGQIPLLGQFVCIVKTDGSGQFNSLQHCKNTCGKPKQFDDPFVKEEPILNTEKIIKKNISIKTTKGVSTNFGHIKPDSII